MLYRDFYSTFLYYSFCTYCDPVMFMVSFLCLSIHAYVQALKYAYKDAFRSSKKDVFRSDFVHYV